MWLAIGAGCLLETLDRPRRKQPSAIAPSANSINVEGSGADDVGLNARNCGLFKLPPGAKSLVSNAPLVPLNSAISPELESATKRLPPGPNAKPIGAPNTVDPKVPMYVPDALYSYRTPVVKSVT